MPDGEEMAMSNAAREEGILASCFTNGGSLSTRAREECDRQKDPIPGPVAIRSRAAVLVDDIQACIGGKVVDPVTGETVFGVRVTARTGQLVYTAQTNDQGAYSIQGIPAGTYAVRFSRPVNYAFQPNPFPDFNYSPEPLVVTLPCGKNVIDGDLKNFHHYGVKVPSIMECGGQPCGWKVSVYDFDDPATATDPNCGTDACDGPEDFNRNPTDRISRIIERGFSLDVDTGNPVEFVSATAFDFNAQGQIAKIDGPRDGVKDWIEYEYFPMDDAIQGNRGTVRRIHAWTTDTRKLTIEVGERSVEGDVKSFTHPNGRTIAYLYDEKGRIIRVNDHDGTHTDYEYDSRGRLNFLRWPSGVFMDYSYANDRLVRTTVSLQEPVGSGVPPGAGSVFKQLGGGIEETDFVEADGRVSRRRTSSRLNDGKILRTFNPDVPGSYSEIMRSDKGDTTVFVSEAGVRTVSTYNEKGHRTSETLPFSPGVEGTRQWHYDEHDNLTEVRDPDGRTTRYTYDDNRRLARIMSPDTGETTYEYDAAGHMAARKDATGAILRYEYDGQGRILRVRTPHGTELPPGILESADTIYEYDAPNHGCPTCGYGKVTRVEDDSGFVTYDYDLKGNLTRESRYILGMEALPYFSHVLAGCGVSFPVQDIENPLFARDAQIVAAEACPELRFVTEYGFDAPGRLKSMTYPTGRITRYYYCGEPGSGTTPGGVFETAGVAGELPAGTRCEPDTVVKVMATLADATCEGYLNPPPADPGDPTQICHAGTGRCVALGALCLLKIGSGRENDMRTAHGRNRNSENSKSLRKTGAPKRKTGARLSGQMEFNSQMDFETMRRLAIHNDAELLRPEATRSPLRPRTTATRPASALAHPSPKQDGSGHCCNSQ